MTGLFKPIMDEYVATKNDSVVYKGSLKPHIQKYQRMGAAHYYSFLLFPVLPSIAIMLLFEPRVQAYLRDKYWAFDIPQSQSYWNFNCKINFIPFST